MIATSERTSQSIHGAAPAGARARARRAGVLEPSAVGPAAFGLVFRAPDGAVRHGRCGEPLDFHGILAGQELDFYCRRCMEHVTLPECLVSQVPVVGAEVSARG